MSLVLFTLLAPSGIQGAQAVSADHCVALIPAELPPVDDVIDQTSFAEDLRDLSWRGVQGTALLSIRLTPGLTQPQPVILETSLSEANAERLERLVGAHLRPRASEHVWGVLLGVRLDQTVVLSVDRSTYCPPRVSRDFSPSDPWSITGRSPDYRVRYDPRYDIPVRMHVLVGENGQITEAQFEGTTHSRLRDELLRAAFFLRYEPAMLDGLPVEESVCWIMQARRRPRPC